EIAKKQKKLVEKLTALFNNYLYKKISANKPQFRQTIFDYYGNWKDSILNNLVNLLMPFMGIFVTTNLSTRYNIPNTPALFDFVIIDEASQNDIASVIPLLFRAKYAIVIGDPNQLRHISHLKNNFVQKFADSCKLGETLIDYHYNKRSAYDLAAKAFQESTGQNPFILKEHYRCHRDIIQFSNYEFYDSKLFPKSYIYKDISPLNSGIAWKHVAGNYKDHANPSEAYAIIDFIEELNQKGLNNNIGIGIITPFRNQKNLILNLLSRKKMITGNPNDKILASTVHSFQGDERDIIIYSPVLSEGINEKSQEWLDKSIDLLNVAITRARNALVIVGDANYCSKTNGIHKKLLDYCLKTEKSAGNCYFESRSEELFYYALKSAEFDFDYQVPIGRYRADFILKQEDRLLCVEIDGYQHDQTKSYDYSRDRYFEELGYKVLRIPSKYAESNIEEILSLLKKTVV
ncbi:MAG: DUF559 domain-containing protein, partial [Desulfamplus sp.]|nr:DUF559 domain-containing protein [Desulfamplus sp.]